MSAVLEKDRRHVWHPFTQHGTERDPVVIKSARGACLYTEDGREILDMISSWWTCAHGHAHPALNAALAQQAQAVEHVMFSGFTHEPAVRLADALARVLPGDLNRVFFSDNGSGAVEVAVKIAYQYWVNRGARGRKTFLAFDGAYHGDTVGAMSVGRGSGFFDAYADLMFSVDVAPYPFTWDGDAEVEAREAAALTALDAKLDAHGDTIAAMIVEPLMQGAGGMRLCRPAFIRRAVEAVQARGIPVIFDEVATGFGRTGALFACEKAGVVPDLICLSKALTSGYMPMAVTVARDGIFDAFLGADFSKAFVHGHSFTANPLACAVANRSLALFEEEKTLEKIAHIEARHRALLPALHAHPRVTMPRVAGPVLAFTLADDDGAYKSPRSEALRARFLERGLNIRPLGDTVYLMPPYCITDAQLSRAYEGMLDALEDGGRQSA